VSFDLYSDFATTTNIMLISGNGLNQLTIRYSVSIPAGSWIHVEQVMQTNSNTATDQVLYFEGFNKVGSVTFANLKLEEGNKSTSWSPAPEDIPEIAASSLTLTDNKISLASKTIELKGNTIAKAIQAEDLKVGSRTGLSALEVLRDGTFYAKGSKSVNESLTIDSAAQSIEIVSPYSANGNPTSGVASGLSSGKSKVSISSQSGGVMVTNDEHNTSIVSTNGIFANKAGQTAYPTSSGLSIYGAIVGLGYGNMAKSLYSDDFIAGVIGVARNSNSNPAPAYGGHFDILKANGLVLGMRTISSTATTNTSLYKTDSLVISSSNVLQNVYLPTDAYKGTVIFLKQWSDATMRIYPGTGQRLYDDNSVNSYIDLTSGWTAMCIYIGEWSVSGVSYPVWLLSKFRF
jgi:hypothetical protein